MLEAEHLAARAERLLRRPGALIEVKGLGYVVRFGPRRRAMLTVDEGAFRVPARGGAPGSRAAPRGPRGPGPGGGRGAGKAAGSVRPAAGTSRRDRGRARGD